MMNKWYFTCNESVAKKVRDGEMAISSGSLEVYSNKSLAVEMRHPCDNCIFEIELDDKYTLSRAFVSATESITWITCKVLSKLKYVDGVLKVVEEKSKRNPRIPEESVLDMWERLIDFTYASYCDKRDTIECGFITYDMIEWLVDRLYLNKATNEQLNECWFAIDRYFHNKMMKKDNKGEWQWRNEPDVDIRWLMDCDSAWKEVVNYVARSRRQGEK